MGEGRGGWGGDGAKGKPTPCAHTVGAHCGKRTGINVPEICQLSAAAAAATDMYSLFVLSDAAVPPPARYGRAVVDREKDDDDDDVGV